jgi:hypothetical protein
MRKRIKDGVARGYQITPCKGYVLHIKGKDIEVENADTHEIEDIKLGYNRGSCTCSIDYDFSVRTITDENGAIFIAYGEKEEYFARAESEVPQEQIY